MLVKELIEREEAAHALYLAYGRSQSTPDGMYCVMGRIDRAYEIAAQKGNKKKYIQAISAMQNKANQLFADADKKLAAHRRVCRLENIPENLSAPECDCPHCQRVPTFGAAYE